jgi:hypothetical protein
MLVGEGKPMKKLYYSLLAILSLVLIPGVASALTQAVPEPSSFLLIIAGLFGILGFRRIFKK